MLSFLSYRKPDHSDSEEEEDDPKTPEFIKAHSVPAAPGISTLFATLSVDPIYLADADRSGVVGGLEKSGVVPKIIKSGTRGNTIKLKQNAENVFAANKNVAESMMDIALLTSNANQLKFLLSYNTKSKMFCVNVTLIVISLFLQVAVGVFLIVKKNLRGRRHSRTIHYINHFVVIGIFFVTVINIFVAIFSTTET